MKNRYKLLIVVIIAAVIGCLFLADVGIAKGYEIKVLQITPDSAPADGRTPVSVTLQVEHSGNVKSGHTIYALAKNGGSFKSIRLVTDEKGQVTFVYYPYLKTSLNTLTDAVLEFRNESNSIFVSVPAVKEVSIKLTEPDGKSDSNTTTDQIFGRK